MTIRAIAAACLASCLAVSAEAATVVFTDDFASGAASLAFSGAGAVVDAQSYEGKGDFADNFLRNTATGNPAAATTLALGGLAAHSAITISFDLAFIDSWDSTNGSPAPDIFNLSLDGTPIFQATTANASGSVEGELTASGASFTRTVNQQGLGFSGWQDEGWSLMLTVAHNAPTATFGFFSSGTGWQGGSDESWALDNVSVSIDGTTGVVPLPAALPLLATAFGGLVALRRRRG